MWAIVFGKRRAGGAPLRRLARAGRCGAPAGPLRAEAGIDLTITGGGGSVFARSPQFRRGDGARPVGPDLDRRLIARKARCAVRARVFGKRLLMGLTALGMVAALLGAEPEGALGAHGDDPDVDFEPIYSACVGAAAESFGFEDTVGSFAEESINCIAHFGVTTGRSATEYAPGESVLRWQMALFLARAARAAGIVLETPASDQGFTDIGGVSASARNAINGLAKAGIMAGTSQTTFGPNSSVTRGSMALLLDAFVREAQPGAGAFGGEVDGFSDVVSDQQQLFTDISGVSLMTHRAIGRIYELGITEGVGDHQFGPERLVTRAQMAVFIARALAHTTARPAGVSLQAAKDQLKGTGDSVDLLVSVRDAAFQPVVDAHVDVFRASTEDDAFRDDGSCAADKVTALVGSAKCGIDVGDEQTDLVGDITLLSLDGITAETAVWAWTGEVGDRFDSDDTAAGQVTVDYAKAANGLLVTTNLADGQTRLKFGETATVVIQVVDEDDVAVPESGHKLTVARSSFADGSSASSTSTMTTDDEGKIAFEFTWTDPVPNEIGDNAQVEVTLRDAPDGLPLRDEDGKTWRAYRLDTFWWADVEPEPTNLVLEQRFDFTEASDEGSGAGASITATLTDQYGAPLRGHTIYFWSDDPVGVGEQSEDTLLARIRNGIATAPDRWYKGVSFRILHDLIGEARYKRTTNRSGEAVLSYTRDADTDAIETVRARLIRGENDLTTADAEDEADLLSEKLSFYWARELGDGEAAAGRILVKQMDARRVVFADGDGRVRMLTYDANDQFSIDGVPDVMADFEKFLDETAAHINVGSYADNPTAVSSIDALSEWPEVDLSAIPVPEAYGRTFTNFNEGIAHYAADGDTIAVGSYMENNYAGAVYVYDGPNDATPTKLTAPTPQPGTYTGAISSDWWNKPWMVNLPTAGGWFGFMVDVRGDTLIVGEPGRLSNRMLSNGNARDGRATDGAVYVYARGDDGGWDLDATLTVGGSTLRGGSAGYRGYTLGQAAVVSGDETHIAACAPRYITAQRRIGGCFIFERPDQTGRNVAADGKWDDDDGATAARVEPSNAYINTHQNRWAEGFGGDRELAISEDGSTVVVGANFFSRVVDGVKYIWAGGAFIFTEPDAGWATQAYDPDAVVWSPTPFWAEKMGRSVAVSADGSTVAVSANFRPNMLRRGKVLVYERPDQTGRSAGDDWDDDLETPTAVLYGSDHPDAPSTCLPASGPVLGCNLGEVFGQWVDISDDGDKILASRAYRTEGNLRGSVTVFTEPAGGWEAVTADAPASSAEYLGDQPKAFLGWRTHFDQATGKIYAAGGNPEANGAIRIWRITP